MLRKITQKLTTTITGGAIIIAVFSILSRVLGLVRDRLLASSFGAGDTLDVYYAAFKLPDLIFNTLVLGALSSAFIPVFIKLLSKNQEGKKLINQQNQEDKNIKIQEYKNNHQTIELLNNRINHWQLSSAVMNLILIALFVLALIVFIFANQLTPLIAPGFNAEKLSLTVKLTRIMLISIIFFGISNVLSGILQSLKRFVAFSLAPVMYNLGIIFAILFLVNKMGPIGLAWGVVLGAILHLVVQLPSVFKSGFNWQPILAIKDKAVRQVGKLMLPRTFALAVNQVNQLVITIIGSTLMAGSIAVFNLAFNLENFPIGVFAISIAVATFPALSESLASNDKTTFIAQFSIAARRILYLIIPTSIFIILLRAQIVRLILGAGAFDWTDTVLTANTLGYFCLSLFAQALVPLVARSFYAWQDTKTPVLVSLLSVGLNIAGSLVLAPIMGVEGLALSFSVSSMINLILLAAILRHRMGSLDDKRVIYSILRISLATIFGAVFLQITKSIIGNLVDMQTFLGVLTQFITAGIVGTLVFFSVSLMLKCEEVAVLKKFLVRK